MSEVPLSRQVRGSAKAAGTGYGEASWRSSSQPDCDAGLPENAVEQTRVAVSDSVKKLMLQAHQVTSPLDTEGHLGFAELRYKTALQSCVAQWLCRVV